MKIKVDGHMLIAFIFSFLAIVISIIITLISVSYRPFSFDFPAYAYHEYVNRSDNRCFENGSGAQFYEAEKATLSNSVTLDDNVGASNGKVVQFRKKNQTIKYSIKFNQDCIVQLKLALCYISTVNKDTNAKNLFSVYLNNVEPYTDLANVKHCYNTYEFKENLICSLEISKGINVIEIISTGEECYVDYMVLIPQEERTDNCEMVGHAFSGFEFEGLRQYYEAEKAELKESYIIQDDRCSDGYYAYSNQMNGKVTFFPNSTKDGLVRIALVMKNCGITEKLTNFCDIFINEERFQTDAFCPVDEVFSEVYLGEISIKPGENEITIVNKGGEYQLDYLVLNTESNYSPNGYTLRYEAEDAKLSQNAITCISPIASQGKSVKSVCVGTEIEYNLSSYTETKTYLSVRLHYTGENTNLRDLFAVYINRTPVGVNDYVVWDMDETQGYREFYVGCLSLRKGNNEIEIYSVTDKEYMLDYITLYSVNAPSTGRELKCEAEKSYLSNGVIEWKKNASGGKIVEFALSTEMEFKIQAFEETSVNLLISLSNNSNTNKALKEYCSILVNGEMIDLSNLYIFAMDKDEFFMEYNIGSISLQKGMNTLQKIGGSSKFYTDYIKFISVA